MSWGHHALLSYGKSVDLGMPGQRKFRTLLAAHTKMFFPRHMRV